MDLLYLDLGNEKSDSTRTIFDSDKFYWAASGDNVAYCFTSISSYSDFGTYPGNSSTTGPVVTTGFEPRFLMLKRTSGSSINTSWMILDSSRDTSNPRNSKLSANSNATENSNTAFNVDFNSTGFQLKTSDGDFNGSGETYLYWAIA